MRYALIIAGGSGTRLWPMSRTALPKQLIPFIGGRCLLQLAVDRLDGLIDADRVFICAGESHRAAIVRSLRGFAAENFIGEPLGRDTLNAVGLGSGVIGRHDPEAIIAVFTADHIIEPADQFRAIVQRGFELVERHGRTLVTFGIEPDAPQTGYGYLQLGDKIQDAPGEARVVAQFKEKPDAQAAQRYLDAGPEKYLWNSGMFVWRADTLMNCIQRFAPENHRGLHSIIERWDCPDRQAVLAGTYPALKKISVDYAIMEPASRDERVRVAAIPMPLQWLDVGSWPAFAQTCRRDEQANALASDQHLLLDTRGTLVASSEPGHIIATIGCENLLIIHTADATLICPADRAQDIKQLHAMLGEKFGSQVL